MRVIKVYDSRRAPCGDLAEGEVDAARLLLVGLLKEVLHGVAGEDLAAAENHCCISSFRRFGAEEKLHMLVG